MHEVHRTGRQGHGLHRVHHGRDHHGRPPRRNPVSGPISDRIGKRKLPVFVSSTIIAIGIAVPWVLKSQFSMFVYAALMGLGYGIYMVVDQALNVDVLPNRTRPARLSAS